MKIRTKLTIKYLTATLLLGIVVFIVLEELLFPREGFDMLRILSIKLLIIWVISFAILFIIGYFMARNALSPVSRIVKQVEKITASSLSQRVETDNPKDEIGELAATFNDTLDRLEESFDSQKMFVSNVSHELRTPLAALIAELELSLRKERSNEDYKQVVENALDDARKIEKLSNGLMDLAKANYHTDQIKMAIVRLDEILLDASAMVMQANNGHSVNLIFDENSNDDRTATILGNEYLLRTAFVNLMENNCKFSQNNTSTVQILFSNDTISIRFTDTGIGISSEDIEQIFKPFYRGKNRHFSTGNGIGMALVERIVKLHNGLILIDSREGKGTVFTVTFSLI
ncbi:MAG: HAMP domain-containing histidine kinase [Dysgonamonadaceae bacterium]|jgi:signal transduction histidine kinase|nr:HAMP domain-containing histidine kinase [Dysgonamonadaceae bacterium]